MTDEKVGADVLRQFVEQCPQVILTEFARSPTSRREGRQGGIRFELGFHRGILAKRKSEIRNQKSEIRNQKFEGRGQKAEGRRQK
jgi:hypothetical protein